MKHSQLAFLELPPGRLKQEREKHVDLDYLAELKGKILRRWRCLLFKEPENGSQKTASEVYMTVSLDFSKMLCGTNIRLLFI